MDELKLYGRNEKVIDKTTKLVTDYTGLYFEIDKCCILVFKRGKKLLCERIVLS